MQCFHNLTNTTCKENIISILFSLRQILLTYLVFLGMHQNFKLFRDVLIKCIGFHAGQLFTFPKDQDSFKI